MRLDDADVAFGYDRIEVVDEALPPFILQTIRPIPREACLSGGPRPHAQLTAPEVAHAK